MNVLLFLLFSCNPQHTCSFQLQYIFLMLRESSCVPVVLWVLFQENYLKNFNQLYVILKVYFSILLSNFFKSLIWSLIFTRGVVSDLLKKWWCNCGQDSDRTSCLKHGRKKSRYMLSNGNQRNFAYSD